MFRRFLTEVVVPVLAFTAAFVAALWILTSYDVIPTHIFR